MPPEYMHQGMITRGVDIYSLGVIVGKIMAGHEGYSSIAELMKKSFIEHVSIPISSPNYLFHTIEKLSHLSIS